MATDSELVYLDNNATTPIRPEVLEAMMPFLSRNFANASGAYRLSREARQAIDVAREQVAALIDARPEEIVFTSGGTESDNTAIASSVFCQPDRRLLVGSEVEHPAILSHFEQLKADRDYQLTLVPVDESGCLNEPAYEKALEGGPALVSLMWANNETGVLFPVREAAEKARASGAFFHTDAVQAMGKVPVSVKDSEIHFLSMSGHKFHAPKGVGALYVNRQARLHPYVIGGGQEQDRRGGTENVAGIVGLGKASELARTELEAGGDAKVAAMRDRLEENLIRELSDVERNGHPEKRLPNTASVAFKGIEAQGLLIMLDQEQICASAGSACHTGSLQPSRILSAMGMSAERATSTVRLSVSHLTTDEELERAIACIVESVKRLRKLRTGGQVVRAT
ncbi:MAG: aminotransferase class V-fold PLP-dependent enzyme [Verrucomicrobiota bacterium]